MPASFGDPDESEADSEPEDEADEDSNGTHPCTLILRCYISCSSDISDVDVVLDEGYYRNDYPDADTDEWSSNEGGERFLTLVFTPFDFHVWCHRVGPSVILMLKLQCS